MIRHASILRRENSALLIVDIQQRINAVMKYRQEVVENTIKLIKGFKILGVPIYITEQYRDGLGPTEPAILEALGHVEIPEKMTFSCCSVNSLQNNLNQLNHIEQVILCGIETHVCVQQTALDLLANSYQVYLTIDAVSSRKSLDHEIGIKRMQQQGVIVTTTESILFELLERADSDEFKKILKIIK